MGLLDDAGYLSAPLREIAGSLGVDMDCVEDALEVVQMLEPVGVGARSLAECLALQARDADRYDPCMEALIDNLELVAKGEIARLKRLCDVDDEDFADMLHELRSFDPKPGLAFAEIKIVRKGVGDHLRLLIDFLLHEMPMVSFVHHQTGTY